LGFERREICIPARALTDLSPAQQEAMLGHELGHASRRDPTWLGLCWMLETVLCIQPLNRLARRRLQHAAELLCDDWAVHLTDGRTLSLASCLTEVAQWVVGRPGALPAPGMAGAPLTLRVERLLARSSQEVTRRERWWLPGAISALLVVALGAPGFSTSADRAPAPGSRGALDLGLARLEARPGPFGLPAGGLPAGGLPAGDAALAPPLSAAPDPDLARADERAAPPELGLLILAVEQTLSESEHELRELKRDLAALGEVERYAERLARHDHLARSLRGRLTHLKTLALHLSHAQPAAGAAPPSSLS
jgi:hypothetical protein